MQIVYLLDGTECYLKETIGTRYVINEMRGYEDENGNWQEIGSLDDRLVDTVYFTKPISKITDEILELTKKRDQFQFEVKALHREKFLLENEVKQIQKTQISQDKLIINKTEISNAKNLVLFPKDEIMPIVRHSKIKSFRGLKLSMEMKLIDGEPKFWGAKIYEDYTDYSSQYLCPKYGVLVDPTDEEVDATIVKRLEEFTFSDSLIANVDDKYLNEKLKAVKNKFLSEKDLKNKTGTLNKIASLTLELEELNKSLNI